MQIDFVKCDTLENDEEEVDDNADLEDEEEDDDDEDDDEDDEEDEEDDEDEASDEALEAADALEATDADDVVEPELAPEDVDAVDAEDELDNRRFRVDVIDLPLGFIMIFGTALREASLLSGDRATSPVEGGQLPSRGRFALAIKSKLGLSLRSASASFTLSFVVSSLFPLWCCSSCETTPSSTPSLPSAFGSGMRSFSKGRVAS